MNNSNSVEKITAQNSRINQSDDYEYTFSAEIYDPFDLDYEIELYRDGKDCDFCEIEEIFDAAVHEIANILNDWTEIVDTYDHYCAFEWEEASEMIDNYMDVIYQTQIETPDFIHNDLKYIEDKLETLNRFVD